MSDSKGFSGPPMMLYGHPYSLDLQRVMAIMQVANIEGVMLQPTITGNLWLDMQGGRPSDKEPFDDTRPQLEDVGNRRGMFKGRAISRFILKKAKSNLLPPDDDPWGYAHFEQACAVEYGDFDPVANELYEQAEANNLGIEHDAERYEELKEDMAHVLAAYERMLSKTKYLAGDKMTAADVFHVPAIRALNKHPETVSSLKGSSNKNVKRWWDDGQLEGQIL